MKSEKIVTENDVMISQEKGAETYFYVYVDEEKLKKCCGKAAFQKIKELLRKNEHLSEISSNGKVFIRAGYIMGNFYDLGKDYPEKLANLFSGPGIFKSGENYWKGQLEEKLQEDLANAIFFNVEHRFPVDYLEAYAGSGAFQKKGIGSASQIALIKYVRDNFPRVGFMGGVPGNESVRRIIRGIMERAQTTPIFEFIFFDEKTDAYIIKIKR